MKIQLHFRRRLALEDIRFYICALCVLSYALLEHMSIGIPWFSGMKMPLLYIAGLCALPEINLILKKFRIRKYFYVTSATIVLCGFLFLSAYMNKAPRFGVVPYRNTYRLILYIAELLILTFWVSEKGWFHRILQLTFGYVLLIVLVVDVMIFADIDLLGMKENDIYIIGTKFSVVYMHMNLLSLWLVRMQDQLTFSGWQRARLIAGGVAALIVTFRVNCMSGVLGCVMLLLLLWRTQHGKRLTRKLLCSPRMLLLFAVASVLFVFVVQVLISIPAVSYFIESVLGRNNNLSGRVQIYEMFSGKMQGHWLFGFGMGNANAAAMALFGYANAQNAILQWVLQTGMLVTVLLVALIVLVFDRLYKNQNLQKMMPMVALIYVYITLGTVETTFSMSFILWVFMLLMYVNQPPHILAQEHKKR